MAWSGHYIQPAGWKATRRRILARDAATCHVCGHDGADEVDHLVNVATWQREQRPGDPHDDANLAPIHGGHCETCGRGCHDEKTAGERRAGYSRWKRPAEQHPGMI